MDLMFEDAEVTDLIDIVGVRSFLFRTSETLDKPAASISEENGIQNMSNSCCEVRVYWNSFLF